MSPPASSAFAPAPRVLWRRGWNPHPILGVGCLLTISPIQSLKGQESRFLVWQGTLDYILDARGVIRLWLSLFQPGLRSHQPPTVDRAGPAGQGRGSWDAPRPEVGCRGGSRVVSAYCQCPRVPDRTRTPRRWEGNKRGELAALPLLLSTSQSHAGLKTPSRRERSTRLLCPVQNQTLWMVFKTVKGCLSGPKS